MSSIGGWTAVVPLKPACLRKTRLAERLSPVGRDALSEGMFQHVVNVLERAAVVEQIVLLARTPPAGWRHLWIADMGRGLNGELSEARDGLRAARLLVLHADLPFLAVADVVALTQQAKAGCAVAPDRHGVGTNALALLAFPDFVFGFGPGSLQLHLAAAQHRARVVARPGLAFDVDTAADYVLAAEAGVVESFV